MGGLPFFFSSHFYPTGPHTVCLPEGGPGGLPNLLNLKNGEKEDEGEEKKEDDDDEEEMEWKRRDEEDMQDSLVLEKGMLVKFPLVNFTSFAAPASRFFPARRS